MPGVGFQEVGIQALCHPHGVVVDPFLAGDGEQGDAETRSRRYRKIRSILKALIAVIEQDGGGTEEHDTHSNCAKGFKAAMTIGVLFVGRCVCETRHQQDENIGDSVSERVNAIGDQSKRLGESTANDF